MTKIGVIVESRGLYYKVQDVYEVTYTCVIRGKIRLNKEYGRLTNPVAVGDYVEFITNTKDNLCVITNILYRKNCLVRKHPLKKNYNQIIASNVDIAVLVSVFVSRNNNRFIDKNSSEIEKKLFHSKRSKSSYSYNKQLFYIDNFLVAAECFGIFPLLLFNKVDLLSDKDKTDLQSLCKIYNDIGYDTMITSATSRKDIVDLKTFLISNHEKSNDSDKEKLSFTKILFTGNSGVGKSTIINALTGREMKTGAVSNRTQKGRHITTHSVMIPIDDMPSIYEVNRKNGVYDTEVLDYRKKFKRKQYKTYVIDTPGIRSLFPSDLGHYYKESLKTLTFDNENSSNFDKKTSDNKRGNSLRQIFFKKHDLAFCFPEMQKLLPCKFHNCTHIHEPGCKIIAALKNGKIAIFRYDNYKKILQLIYLCLFISPIHSI